MDDHHEPKARTSPNEYAKKKLQPISPDSCSPSIPHKVKSSEVQSKLQELAKKMKYREGRQNVAL